MYFCPCCGTKNIIDFGSTFVCCKCTYDFTSKGKVYHQPLEFDKENFDSIEDKADILSIQETMGIVKVLANSKKVRKIQKLKSVFY